MILRDLFFNIYFTNTLFIHWNFCANAEGLAINQSINYNIAIYKNTTLPKLKLI